MKAIEPQGYVVIFKSKLKKQSDKAYAYYAKNMEALVKKQKGYLGHFSYREKNGFGLTLSYWTDEQALLRWKQHKAHLEAQEKGKEQFYSAYTLEIAKITRSYSFS